MKFETFKKKVDPSWYPVLEPFVKSRECDDIYDFLKEKKNQGYTISPKSENTWNAFKYCKYDDLKVVVIGYDPYPQEVNGELVADGLAFSSSTTNKFPASLQVLYQGINDDVYPEEEIEANKDLKFLALQGVLLLNISLTVEVDDIGSHSKEDLWIPLHRYLIEKVFNLQNNGLIYILLGREAQKLRPYISKVNAYVFEDYHPSYFARNKKPWKTCVFSTTNKVLQGNLGKDYIIHWDNKFFEEYINQVPF